MLAIIFQHTIKGWFSFPPLYVIYCCVNLKHITILFKIFLVDLSIYLLKEDNFIRKERNKNYSRVFLVDDNKVKDHELEIAMTLG